MLALGYSVGLLCIPSTHVVYRRVIIGPMNIVTCSGGLCVCVCVRACVRAWYGGSIYQMCCMSTLHRLNGKRRHWWPMVWRSPQRKT